MTNIPTSVQNKIDIAKQKKSNKLDLSGEIITDISFLEDKGLLHVKELYLNDTPISDISILEKLPQLSWLYLSNTKINDISVLQRLPELRELDLSNTHIYDVSVLQNLSYLSFLNLNNTRTVNISALQNLSELRRLDLSNTKIISISALVHLSKLSKLYLSNTLVNDISVLQSLLQLRWLSLNNTRIDSISILEKLTQLRWLDLRNTQISNISILKGLLKLEWLFLPFSSKLDYSVQNTIRTLHFQIEEHILPQEVWVRGDYFIKMYYKDLERQGKEYLYEAKLLIVGEGESGKTTLAWKLNDIYSELPKKENDRTKGIDIQPLEIVNQRDSSIPFKMNVWDFGGQEIYHATHQFF